MVKRASSKSRESFPQQWWQVVWLPKLALREVTVQDADEYYARINGMRYRRIQPHGSSYFATRLEATRFIFESLAARLEQNQLQHAALVRTMREARQTWPEVDRLYTQGVSNEAADTKASNNKEGGEDARS